MSSKGKSDIPQTPEKVSTGKPLPGMERSFAVLEMLASRPSRVVDVTKELDLPWATVHRTIKKLESAQFIYRDPETNRYEIGPRMWHIGSAYLANNKPMNAAISYLATERNIKNVDIQIVERIGNYAVVTHAEKRQTHPISKAQYGFHIPLHAGSKGWVLLAHESPDFIARYVEQDLEQLTPLTITDKSELLATISKVRDNGFAFTLGDVQPFTGSIAAPIFGSSGNMVACVCFVFLKKIASNTKLMEELREHLELMTHTISIELGWRPGQG
ncbi:MAG: IclR family transcriptional regulator [Hyphomicrobiales bacterium]|nr:IclR family transcriptional regulator [Hyphomicrobiales bacterium]MCP4997194.1 IclR family transcriptional regulator [Hyphomicrobiales bacterium]